MAKLKNPVTLPGPNLTRYQRDQILAMIASAKQRLLDIDPDIEKDDKLFLDTLDGETDALDIIRAFGRAYLDDLAWAQGTALRIADMERRKDRFERRAEAKRAAVYAFLQVAGLPGLPDTDFDAGTKKGKPSVGVDEKKVQFMPPEFVSMKTTFSPKKRELMAALQAGKEIDGAWIDNGAEIFEIRRK